MTRPTSLSDELPTLTHHLGFQHTTGSLSSNTVDRATGLDVFVPPSAASIALVNSATGGNSLGGQAAVGLGDTATSGNLLVFSVATRGSAGAPATPSGWTAHPDGSLIHSGGSTIAMYYKVSDGTETDITFTPNGGGGWIGGISEWSGVTAVDTNAEDDGTGNPVTGATVTPTAGTEALIIGSLCIVINDFANSVTPDGDWDELHDAMVPQGGGVKNPLLWSAYQIVASASGSYTPSGECTHGAPEFVAQSLAFSRTSSPVNGGPNATDGDASTCIEGLSGAEFAAIDLGDHYEIARANVRLAIATGGSRTYSIQGANLADFSDATTLDSVTFTAQGSFIAQDIVFSWGVGTSKRYYRLVGPDEERNLCSWELYEGSLGEFHDHDFIPEATFDALGDLLVGTGSDSYARKGSVSSNVYSLQTRQDGDLEWQPFVRSLVSNGSNTLQRPDVNLVSGTGITFGISSNSLTISSTASGGGGALAYSATAADVAGTGAGGASAEVSRGDHAHKGVFAVAHASNSFSGTVTLTTPGNTIGISSPTPGTYALTAAPAAAAGGGGGSGASTANKYVTTLAAADLSAEVVRQFLGNYYNETYPASPDADYNDEFDDTTGNSGSGNGLNARWNWRNQGGATTTFTQAGYLSLNCPAQASSNWRIIEIADLDDGTYEAKIGLESIQTQVGQAGIVIVDGTNGDFYTVELARLTNGANVLVQRFTNVTTFSAALASFSIGFLPPEMVLRVVRSGTAMEAWASVDGRAFLRIHTWTDAIGASRIGLGVNESNNTGTSKLVADYFRKVS